MKNLRRVGGLATVHLIAAHSKTSRHRQERPLRRPDEPKCGEGGGQKCRPWRSGEHPGEDETQESNDLIQSDGSARYGLSGRSKTLKLRRTVIFRKPQSGRLRLLKTAREYRRREAHGCPRRSKALKGEPQERHRSEKGRTPVGGVNRRRCAKHQGRNVPEDGTSGSSGLRRVMTVVGDTNPTKAVDARKHRLRSSGHTL